MSLHRLLGFGFTPQQPDPRDYDIRQLQLTLDGAPDAFDLEGFGHVVNQGGLNSCVGESIAGAINIREHALGVHDGKWASPIFPWSLAKAMRGVRGNHPVSIRDAFLATARLGICDEEHMPRSTEADELPSGKAFAHAVGRRLIVKEGDTERRVGGYYAIKPADVETVFDQICASIWSRRAVTTGTSYYDSDVLDEDRGPGDANNPIDWSEIATRRSASFSGHAMLFDGYDRKRGILWLRNTRGLWWRQGGRAAITRESLSYFRDHWVVDGWERLAQAQKGLVLHAQ